MKTSPSKSPKNHSYLQKFSNFFNKKKNDVKYEQSITKEIEPTHELDPDRDCLENRLQALISTSSNRNVQNTKTSPKPNSTTKTKTPVPDHSKNSNIYLSNLSKKVQIILLSIQKIPCLGQIIASSINYLIILPTLLIYLSTNKIITLISNFWETSLDALPFTTALLWTHYGFIMEDSFITIPYCFGLFCEILKYTYIVFNSEIGYKAVVKIFRILDLMVRFLRNLIKNDVIDQFQYQREFSFWYEFWRIIKGGEDNNLETEGPSTLVRKCSKTEKSQEMSY